jgi:hypothetical protein
MINWEKVIEFGDLFICTTKEAKEAKVYPNRLARVKHRPRLGALVVWQSGHGFQLGLNGLKYIENLLREDKLDEGYVLLLRIGPNGKTQFVNAAPVAEVAAKVAGVEPETDWGLGGELRN